MEIEKNHTATSLPTPATTEDGLLGNRFALARRDVSEAPSAQVEIFESPTSHFGMPEALQMATNLIILNNKTTPPTPQELREAYALDAIVSQNDALFFQNELSSERAPDHQPVWVGGIIGMGKETLQKTIRSRITYLDGSFIGELFFHTKDIPPQLKALLPSFADDAFINIFFSDKRSHGRPTEMEVRIAVSSLSVAHHKPTLDAYLHILLPKKRVLEHDLTVGNTVRENPWEYIHE